jgi:crotonobetaine/carnitine-CoA ligase
MHDPRNRQTVTEVLDCRATGSGDRTWIITPEGRFGVIEMRDRSLKLAAGLLQIGVKKGQTVLLMLSDSIDLVTAWLGLARIGAIEVPVNVHLKGGVLEHVLLDSSANTLITSRRFLDSVVPLLYALPRLTTMILVDTPTADDLAALRDRRVLRLADLMVSSRQEPPPSPRPNDLVAVMYTSGTTGRSKGVMITHTHAYEYAHSVIELLEMQSSDIYYNPLPLFHIAGQWAAVYASLIAGATVVLPTAFSLSRFWDDVRKASATCTFLLGAMANWLNRQPVSATDADNPMQRMLIVPLLAEVEEFKARFGVKVSTTWGSTEINVPTRSGFMLANNRTCGRVAEDRYDVRLVDADDREVPPGVPGEAIVRTHEPWLLMAGYWNNAAATTEAWRNQWLHSGDILMRDETGNLYFVDRLKDSIRRRGENISSMEVEAEILAHEAVLECAVIPVASEHSEDEVMAVVTLKPGFRLDPEDLVAFLVPRMARFMLPRYIDFVIVLPKTPTGKIQKYVLRQHGVTATTWDRDKARACDRQA